MKNLSVNIIGYINKQFGLGEGTRANIRSLNAIDLPLEINDFNFNIVDTIKDQNHDEISKLSLSNKSPINIVQLNIDKLTTFIEHGGSEYLKGKYNIGFWVWELNNFPKEGQKFYNLFDEIWTPSSFSAASIAKSSPIPVITIPHSININRTPHKRSHFGLEDECFYFLSIFDYSSSIERKNPLGTISAYEKAFGINNPKIKLIIKSSIRPGYKEEKSLIEERLKINSSIIYIERSLERDEIYSLINVCDCFISLHKSEGFGLTMAEAMFLNKPIIATAYSGNTDFMNVNNSFMVKYSLTSAKNYNNMSTDQDLWAEPNIEHAAECMKDIYNNPTHASQIARQGMLDIKNQLNPKKTGITIKNRLALIQEHLNEPRNHKEYLNKISLQQIKIGELEEKLNSIKKLPSVQLKLKFKDFKNRISGKDRKYNWE